MFAAFINKKANEVAAKQAAAAAGGPTAGAQLLACDAPHRGSKRLCFCRRASGEFEINDYIQHARWRVTQRETVAAITESTSLRVLFAVV